MVNRRPAWLREFEKMTAAMASSHRKIPVSVAKELSELFVVRLERPELPPATPYLN